MNATKLFCIVGPTGSGKTYLSELLSEKIPVEIISADSRQIYKYLDIGTAKPSVDFLKKIKHHFIDSLTPTENFNAGDFSVQAKKKIADILLRQKIPLVVGGTGLYIRSLIDGIFEGPPANDELRNKLFQKYQDEGGESLLRQLEKVDSDSAQKMLPTNKLRIVRALEVYLITGKPISQLQREQTNPISYEVQQVALLWDIKKLYQNINHRVEEMLEKGFVEEVISLQNKGFDSSLQSLQTVGYKEVFSYLHNEIPYKRMVELIKQNSRRFAKRQMTWFRADSRIQWYPITNTKDFYKIAEQILRNFRL